MAGFQPHHYPLLLPLKQKWETFKVSKHISILLHERAPLSAVYRELKGIEPRWSCTQCVIDNFRYVMNLFDKWEKENVTNPVVVEVKQEIRRMK